MKSTLLSGIRCLTLLFALLSYLPLSAQSSMAPVASEPGTVLEYKSTDKYGTSQLMKQETVYVRSEGGKLLVGIKDLGEVPEGIPQEMYDEMLTMEYIIDEHSWSIDIISKISKMLKASMSAIKNTEGAEDMAGINIEVDTDGSENPIFPISMKKGDKLSLKPVKVKIKVSFVSMTSEIVFDRYECTGTETVTVPAGTFDTYIVEKEITNKMKALGLSNKEKEYSKTWYAPGVGTIKSQTTDKKGNITSERVLNSITKPE